MGESYAKGPREHRRAVEHHQGKGAGAKQKVGAPCAAGRFWWANHPESLARELGPVAWVEGASRIHPSHAVSGGKRGGDDRTGDACLAESGGGEELGESAVGKSAAGQQGIERWESGGKCRGLAGRSAGDDRGDPGPEIGRFCALLFKGERHT